MSRWSVAETRLLVSSLYGVPQRQLIAPCLRSVVDRQAYAKFHYHEARKLLERFLEAHLQSDSLVEIIFGGDEDKATDFQEFITKVGAHVTACAQSMHAVADILAHALYYGFALNLNESPLKDRDITAASVLKKMKKRADLGEATALFEQLTTDTGFVQLSALVNHGKHRSIINPSLSEDQTGLASQRHTLKLTSFTYDGIWYNEVEIGDFLGAEYDRGSRLVIKIGNALNAVLRRREDKNAVNRHMRIDAPSVP